ncbi:hypothetical protein D3C78_1151150 [compost metagenome]
MAPASALKPAFFAQSSATGSIAPCSIWAGVTAKTGNVLPALELKGVGRSMN